MRACVRACVKGWRRSPYGCAQTAESGWGGEVFTLHMSGLGREGKDMRAGKKGLEEKRDDCTDCGILQPVGRMHSLQSSALELFWCPARVCCCSGKGREGTKQASKLSPPTPANSITIPLKPAFSINPSRSPFAPIGPRRTAN